MEQERSISAKKGARIRPQAGLFWRLRHPEAKGPGSSQPTISLRAFLSGKPPQHNLPIMGPEAAEHYVFNCGQDGATVKVGDEGVLIPDDLGRAGPEEMSR